MKKLAIYALILCALGTNLAYPRHGHGAAIGIGAGLGGFLLGRATSRPKVVYTEPEQPSYNQQKIYNQQQEIYNQQQEIDALRQQITQSKYNSREFNQLQKRIHELEKEVKAQKEPYAYM